jgi:hypothetical protein
MSEYLGRHPEQVALPERSLIGPDLTVHTETTGSKRLPPNHTIDVFSQIPGDYFDADVSQQLWQFSVRSVLQQAGCHLLYTQDTAQGRAFTLRNPHPETELIIPEEFDLGRYFVQGEQVAGSQLAKQAEKFPSSALDSDQSTLILPIQRFAQVTAKHVDVSQLINHRPDLDQLLGLQWGPSIQPKLGQMILGESEPIHLPEKTIGKILVGTEAGSIHGQSPLIDSGFADKVRTEIFHLSHSLLPQQHIRMQFFKA